MISPSCAVMSRWAPGASKNARTQRPVTVYLCLWVHRGEKMCPSTCAACATLKITGGVTTHDFSPRARERPTPPPPAPRRPTRDAKPLVPLHGHRPGFSDPPNTLVTFLEAAAQAQPSISASDTSVNAPPRSPSVATPPPDHHHPRAVPPTHGAFLARLPESCPRLQAQDRGAQDACVVQRAVDSTASAQF